MHANRKNNASHLKKSLDNINQAPDSNLNQPGQEPEYNSVTLDCKPIKIAEQFVDEIIEFIHKMIQA